MRVRAVIFLLTVLLFSCSSEQGDRIPSVSLLLKAGTPLHGTVFRPPARIPDIKGFGWESADGKNPNRIWMFLNDDSPIITPAPGRVCYADNQGRNGNEYLIGIEHGKNIRSTISGLSGITVREGARLKADSIIGKASGYIHVQLYVRKSRETVGPLLRYRSLTAREPAWIPLYTAPYILGRGGE